MRTRSLLFIPGKTKTLAKLLLLNSDSYIIDLEDSIEEANKETALAEVVQKLQEVPAEELKRIVVRLNKDRYLHEAVTLKRFPGIGFMLPKFEEPQEYEAAGMVFRQHGVIALIETPKGITGLKEICSVAWIRALAFGAEDYTAFVGMKNDAQLLSFQKGMLITYARAYGKQVYDTPSFALSDAEKFEAEVRLAADLGFDGKLAIHPKQIETINQIFGMFDLDAMQQIVAAYEAAGQAVLVIDGQPYEKMHINRMKRILKEKGRN